MDLIGQRFTTALTRLVNARTSDTFKLDLAPVRLKIHYVRITRVFTAR